MAKGILKKPSMDSGSLGKKVPFLGDKNDRHDLLIAEFKQAHRRMFANSSSASSSVGEASESESDGGQERHRLGGVAMLHNSDGNRDIETAATATVAAENKATAMTNVITISEEDQSVGGVSGGGGKPKAPPPPPPVKTSRLLSAQLSSSSSESLPSSARSLSLSTFKPDRYSMTRYCDLRQHKGVGERFFLD